MRVRLAMIAKPPSRYRGCAHYHLRTQRQVRGNGNEDVEVLGCEPTPARP